MLNTFAPLPASRLSIAGASGCDTFLLTDAAKAEILRFLAARPLHNVVLIGLVMDNGLANPANRGTFYGCRNMQGQLEGVALIGHATLIDARSNRALILLSELAAGCPTLHVALVEGGSTKRFLDRCRRTVRRSLKQYQMAIGLPIEVRPAEGA